MKMIEYQNGEFCEAIGCPNNVLRKMGVLENCKLYCNAFKMHVWLDDNGYKIIKEIEHGK